jgi:hypothetical protein
MQLIPAEIYQRSNEYQQQKETVTSWLNNEYQTIKVIEGFKPAVRPVDGFKERIILYFILGRHTDRLLFRCIY